MRRITGTSLGRFFADEVAGPLGGDFHIGTSAEADPRIARLIPPPPVDPGALQLPEIGLRTLSNPIVMGELTSEEWWRRAEIPAANGHRNARSVAAIQSEARGVKLLSPEGVEALFEQQSNGDDLVLVVPLRFGLVYGLSSATMPMGPHSCDWGGYGGSLIFNDLSRSPTS